jgi:hypothetical protein
MEFRYEFVGGQIQDHCENHEEVDGVGYCVFSDECNFLRRVELELGGGD